MRVVLEVRDGPDAGKTLELRPGQVAQVGRSSWADLPVAGDPALADLHFLLESGASSCVLRDLGSPGGTFHKGRRVSRATLGDGDEIRAGRTTFVVRLGAGAAVARLPDPLPTAGDAPSPAPEATARAEDVPTGDPLLQVLRSQEEPLFALLDAARDVRVVVLLQGSGEQFQSLYEGPKGEQLALVAPYLVRLPAESPLLEALAREGWGRSWGVYLTSLSPLAELRKHCRRFVLVRTEAGKQLYFRFYDPRVLRVYLPTCTSDEARDFFGPVGYFLMEGEQPGTLLRFAADGRGVRQENVTVTARPAEGEAHAHDPL